MGEKKALKYLACRCEATLYPSARSPGKHTLFLSLEFHSKCSLFKVITRHRGCPSFTEYMQEPLRWTQLFILPSLKKKENPIFATHQFELQAAKLFRRLPNKSQRY